MLVRKEHKFWSALTVLLLYYQSLIITDDEPHNFDQ